MLRKKDHRAKELLLQTEEDHKTITMLNDAMEKLNEKVKVYKRQLNEQVSTPESCSMRLKTRVRNCSELLLPVFQEEIVTSLGFLCHEAWFSVKRDRLLW